MGVPDAESVLCSSLPYIYGEFFVVHGREGGVDDPHEPDWKLSYMHVQIIFKSHNLHD